MADYIGKMRKLIGHRPLLMCGASVLVEDNAGRVLLERRQDNGCWCYPGGAVELFEEVEDAARRELFEETRLIANELTLFGVFSGPQLAYTYPNGDEVSIIDVAFRCKSYSGTLRRQQSEVTELAFFDIAHLPENFNPPCKKTMRHYIKLRESEKTAMTMVEMNDETNDQY